MTPVTRLTGPLARAAAALLFACASIASAQVDDLPGRVGRLADLGGRVYVSTEERAEDWIEALRNYSVTSGDNLWVTGDGRAEIDYGGGQFRLAGDTNVHVARLDDRMLSLFVAHGRVIVRVRVLDAGEAARIDTPNTQVALTRPGLYRIEVSDDREFTTIVVREGEATVAISAGVQQVLPGQSATVHGDEPSYADVRAGYALDGFDTWSADRDRRYERSRAATYVSRQMIGYADLDDYGRWETTTEYGAIWYPSAVAADWAPYRYGRWTWVGGFGWTWVDDAPWGYAPFHYGRWVYAGNRWGWCPGAYVPRPAWAPALVAWYGGSGWTASVSFGAPVYGWVPLGWGEPYIPWWRGCSDRCWQRYNRPYAVNYAERRHAPPTRYVNWSAPGGVTAVAGATFTGRRPVHTNLVAVRPQAIANAPVLTQAPVLAKPTAATIPGAKPTIAAPPPAAQFRTKPLQVAPATTPTWGGESQPRGGRGSAPSGSVSAPSGRTAVPPAGVAPRPATSAPPAQPGYAQPAPAPAAGTWGAPASAVPPSGYVAPAPSRAAPSGAAPGSVPNRAERYVPPASAQPSSVPNRAERYVPPASAQPSAAPPSAPPASYRPPAAAYAPPASAAPGRSSAPPAVYSPPSSAAPGRSSAPPAVYSPPSSAAPGRSSAPPAVYSPPAQVAPVAPQASRPAPRAVPPSQTAVPPAAAPPPAAAAPAPQGVRSAPQTNKPVPQRDGEKPTVQR